jgi:CRP/FNR family transcriptional regulator, anaerobic regulatory protein
MTMIKDTDYLKFPFYAAMSEEDKTLLRSKVQIREIGKGQIMMGDNRRCTGIPMVMKGKLRLFRVSEKGREMTLYRIGEGELCILAAVCALGDSEYDFTIEAEKDSELAVMPPDIFKELLYRSDAFRIHVFNALASRLVLSIDTIEMLIFMSIEERLIEYLQRSANAAGEVKITHEQLAIELGSSREVITRQLQKMAEKGILALKRGKIVLRYTVKT